MVDKTAIRRHLIGAALRQYRDRFGYTLSKVAELLECHPSKVCRIETGQRGIRPKELRELLELYGIREPEQDLLLAIEESTRGFRPAWWQEYASLLAGPLLEQIVLEEHVSQIELYAPTAVPPLLQTDDYAYEAALADPSQPEGTEDDSADAVRLRQAAVLQTRKTPLHVVIGEAALRQQIGDADILRDQLRYLAGLASGSEQITVQLLPLETEAAAAHGCGSYSILHFPAVLDLRLVYLDGPAGGVMLDDPDTVAAYATAHIRLCQTARTPEASLEVIQRLADK